MVVTRNYIDYMNISIKDAKDKFSELVRRAEAGETVVITNDGKPVAGILDYNELRRLKLAALLANPPRGLSGKVQARMNAGEPRELGKPAAVKAPQAEPVSEEAKPKEKRGGINWEALEAFKKQHGITKFVEFIAEDFDDPLPEDYLITPES